MAGHGKAGKAGRGSAGWGTAGGARPGRQGGAGQGVARRGAARQASKNERAVKDFLDTFTALAIFMVTVASSADNQGELPMPRKTRIPSGTIINETPTQTGTTNDFTNYSVNDLTEMRARIDQELRGRLKQLDEMRQEIAAAIQVEVERESAQVATFEESVSTELKGAARAPRKKGVDVTNAALLKAIRQSGKSGASRSEIIERLGFKGSGSVVTQRLGQLFKTGRVGKTGATRNTRWTVAQG